MREKAFLLFSFLICLISIVADADPCPPANLIQPCICVPKPSEAVTTCRNISDAQTLEGIFQKSHEWPLYDFILENSNAMYFPASGFTSKKFLTMTIANATFTMLFNEPPSSDNHLTQLTLINVHIQRGIQWEYFRNLNRLYYLRIENVAVKKLDRMFKENISENLYFLKLSNTRTTSFEDTAFQRLKKLRKLYVPSSKITVLKRSMFPNPCILDTVDFTENNIKSLPPDVFSNMPNLQVVYMAENKLTTITYSTFGEVYNRQDHYIMLYDNPLKCDCSVQWVVYGVKKGWLLGKCAEPDDKKGKYLSDLTRGDFSFCPRSEEFLQ